MSNFDRPARSPDGAFFHDETQALGTGGPRIFDRALSARLGLRLEMLGIEHVDAFDVLVETLTLQDYWFFNAGLDRFLSRMLSGNLFIDDIHVTGIGSITEVLRSDTWDSHPGWEFHADPPSEQNPYEDEGDSPFSGNRTEETATGARAIFGHGGASLSSNGYSTNVTIDGTNLHGILLYLESTTGSKFPLMAFSWGGPIQNPGSSSRVRWQGWIHLEPESGDVTSEGLNEALGHGWRPFASISEERYWGLFDSGSAAELTSVMASPPFSEFANYDQSDRSRADKPTASQVQDGEYQIVLRHATGASIPTLSEDATITGAFLGTGSAKGSTNGELFGASEFASPVNGREEDRIRLTYAINLFADDSIGSP